ncbi:MAG TPA: APC family permease [Solirubrobacteraceae bacterium]|jgi:amino acid transporter|nr:APC family permease [Solirubrobacteraceae bacterium]
MASIGSAADGHLRASGEVVDKGLKKNAIGYLSNLVIGVASTAPAYSLAATLGFIVAVTGVGVHAPAVLLVSFVPMLLIAAAYKYLNRADPDAGTTFAWTTRALGPGTGWVNGWAIFLSDVLVMASLADIAGIYTFKLFGFTELSESLPAIIVAAIVWIALMTWICYRGIELSARIQQFLLGAEIAILSVFAVVTFIKVYANHPAGSIEPALTWFNPFALSFKALIDGVLLGIFIYWGWDSGVAVNEESEDANEGPGRAAVMSTILLVLIYVIVSAAGQAYGGTHLLTNPENQSDVLSVLGSKVFGFPWDKLLIIAVLTSASASTQTTILPTARTTLSMAHWKSIPGAFGRIHSRYFTPGFSTLMMGGASILWTLVILNLSESALEDSIVAIGFPICFYYGFTGIACIVYYRHELTKSVRDFLLLGLAPLLGALMLFGVAGYAIDYYSKAENVSSKPILGITLPLWMGIGGMLIGVILMLVSRPFFRDFFSRKLETAKPGLLEEPVEHAPARF